MKINYYDLYSKTILNLATCYAQHGASFLPNNNQWDEFALFLCVNTEELKKVLLTEEHAKYDASKGYLLFSPLIKSFIIKSKLKQIKNYQNQDINDEQITAIYSALKNITCILSTLNIELNEYLCLEKQEFSWNDSLQDWEDYSIINEIDSLLLFLSIYTFKNPQDKNIFYLKLDRIIYDIRTRVSSLLFLDVLIIISQGEGIPQPIKDISHELYLYLISIFKNSRLIGLKINIASPQNSPEDRSKANNTTQLLLVYGYNNYDSYCLRLDMPHAGIEFLHWNNCSPGGIKDSKSESCTFTEDKYNEILNKYPHAKDWFISYGKIYALKERTNCIANHIGWEKEYNDIAKINNHAKITTSSYSDDTIVSFIRILSLFFPNLSNQPIDKEYNYAIKCFNCDSVMLDLTFLLLTIKTMECVQDLGVQKELDKAITHKDKLIDTIVKKASNYNILPKSKDNSEFNNIDGIKEIVNELFERINFII